MKVPLRHIAAALFCASVVAPLSWMVFDTAPVLKIYSSSISPDPVVAGGEVTISWEAAQLRKCDGRVSRKAVNLDTKIVTDYAWQPVVFRGENIGERTTTSRTFTAPSTPGKYIHFAHVERWCNWLQREFPYFRIRETNSVLEFTVVARPP